MNALLRRRFLAGLLAASGFCTGCGDLGSLVYFLSPEQKIPAEIKSLATSDKKKEVKALILVSNSADRDFAFMTADRELGRSLHKQLSEMVAYNEEHLTLIDMRKVEMFKSSHPRWEENRVEEIGEHFHVDYVIYIEINELSTRNLEGAYRARAELSISLIDVKHPDDSTPPKNFTLKYPSEHNFILADAETDQEFREKFLACTAKRLAWYFAAHPASDLHNIE